MFICDGKRDSEEVLKNTAGLGVTANDLQTLVSMRMLVGISPAVLPPTAAPVGNIGPGTAANLAPQASRSVSPEELKILIRRATKELENLLGPSCEPTSLKLEKSKTYDEYAIKIHDIWRVLSSIRSEKVAEGLSGPISSLAPNKGSVRRPTLGIFRRRLLLLLFALVP